MRGYAVSLLLGLIAVSTGAGAAPLESSEWSRFRGPGGTGISGSILPAELNLEKNLLWKTECGKGVSSPVVVGGNVFLTAFEGDERLVKCFDAATGAERWSQSVRKERTEPATPPGGPTSSTPVADSSSVFAFFPDTGLLCFDHEGKERWRVAVGPFQSFHGIAASLVLVEGNVVLLVDQLQGSFMAAFNCQTGAQSWKVVRED